MIKGNHPEARFYFITLWNDELAVNLQSSHCGPLLGPHLPSEPGIAYLPNLLPQYSVSEPDPVPGCIKDPARFFLGLSRNS